MYHRTRLIGWNSYVRTKLAFSHSSRDCSAYSYKMQTKMCLISTYVKKSSALIVSVQPGTAKYVPGTHDAWLCCTLVSLKSSVPGCLYMRMFRMYHVYWLVLTTVTVAIITGDHIKQGLRWIQTPTSIYLAIFYSQYLVLFTIVPRNDWDSQCPALPAAVTYFWACTLPQKMRHMIPWYQKITITGGHSYNRTKYC